MKGKNILFIALVFAIALVVYVAVFLLIPFEKNISSWLSLGFTIFAVCAGACITLYAFNRKTTTSKFYGFPIFKIGMVYAIVQFVAGLIICVISAFVEVPYWISVLLFIIIAAVFAVGLIATSGTRASIENIEEQTDIQTKTINTFRINMQGIVDVCSNNAVKPSLAKLAEEFRYSDPVSNESTEELEAEISVKVNDLRRAVTNDDIGSVNALIFELNNMLSERNRICKLTKGK